jgi:hypothetical protein
MLNKALIGIGVLAIAYYIWQDNKKKKNLVGVRPIEYKFKDFASVEVEPLFVQDGLMPQFGRRIIIKNR